MYKSLLQTLFGGLVVCVVTGCSEPSQPANELDPTPAPEISAAEPTESGTEPVETPEARFGGVQLEMPADIIIANPSANAERSAYYGDLHVHTTYSFDAFAFGTLATPYDAYRYAMGEAIKHPA